MINFSLHHNWNKAWFLLINWYLLVASELAELVTILGNYGAWRKPRDFMRLLLCAQSSTLNKNFVSTRTNLLKKHQLNVSGSMLLHMNTRICLEYFAKDCLWKQTPPSKLTLTSFKSSLFDNFYRSKVFHAVSG